MARMTSWIDKLHEEIELHREFIADLDAIIRNGNAPAYGELNVADDPVCHFYSLLYNRIEKHIEEIDVSDLAEYQDSLNQPLAMNSEEPY